MLPPQRVNGVSGRSIGLHVRWRDNLVCREHFHGDNGAAIGAAHQTGWTGLIADVICRRHAELRSVGDIGRPVGRARG